MGKLGELDGKYNMSKLTFVIYFGTLVKGHFGGLALAL